MVGTLLGGCIIEERIGGGGMGVVYRARDRHLRRTVAVKILRPESLGDSEMRDRFHREASSAAGIEHDNVVRIYSIDIDDQGQPYIVMEYVDGPDLHSLLLDGPLAQDRALRIFAQVGSALQAVHQFGLVHRDVKPANIILRSADTRDERAMLTDFGIAKALDSQTNLTFGMIGTPEYMAPEVADLQAATDRSDQYSLALVLYKMLTGEHLFQGLEMPKAHRDEPVPDIRKALPETGLAVSAALERALSKEPAERFPSVAAFVKAVEEQPESEAGTPPLQRLMQDVLVTGALSTENLAAAVSSRSGPSVEYTALQVEGRARLYSQLFRRTPDGLIELRSHA
jgi:serine/threonine protein kinase